MAPPHDPQHDQTALADDDAELEAALLPGVQFGDGEPPAAAATQGKRILAIGAPLVVEEVVSFGSTLVAMGLVGRLGATALGAYTLAHSVTNITGIALLNGVTGSVDTFSSQAHGSRAYAAIGLTLQRALGLSLLTCAPVVVLLLGPAHALLLAMGQQAALAATAARYMRIFAPTVPLHAVSLCLYRTLASQGATTYVLAAGTLFFAVTGPIHWLLIFKLGLGLDGSALAFVALELLYIVCLTGLAAVHNARRPPAERWWRGWSREGLLTGWGPFLRLSLAAVLMVVADWWIYDVLTLLVGLLPAPDVPLAATGIIYNLNALVFMVSFGLAYAMGARVGHLLGAGQPRAAKLAAQVGTAMGLAFAVVASATLLLLRRHVAALFTSDAEVIEACSSLMLPLAVLIITNGTTATQSGILHGSGRQKHGAIANAAANYGFGLPLMLLLGFKLRGGVEGLWWGETWGSLLQAAVLMAVALRLDWRAEAARAARLLHHLSKGDRLDAAADEAAAALAGEDSAAALSSSATAPLSPRRGSSGPVLPVPLVRGL